MSRQYYGIEAINLTAQQRDNLVNALKILGANQHPQPSHRNHWRIRLDNLAVIFEGEFDDTDWTVENVKNRLANFLGIDPSLVTSNLIQTIYGPAVTYTRTTDRLRMIAFGGLLASWEESHNTVLLYLKDNLVQWETI